MLGLSRRAATALLFVAFIAVLGVALVVVVPRVRLERAKDPGLGVRDLHAQGVTGAGVSVAIIDGQLRRDHVEYADRLVSYEELDDFSGLVAPPRVVALARAIAATGGIAVLADGTEGVRR